MRSDPPHRYLPFLKGKYEVSPGLKPLGADGSIGMADQRIFQIDEDVPFFLQNKQACREEDIGKYYCTHREDTQTIQAVNQFIIRTLVQDYPEHFHLTSEEGSWTLQYAPTGEILKFSSDYQLHEKGKYHSLFDALCSQVPEDLAIWQVKNDADWLAALHICAPNYWSPEEKIGRNFYRFHAPVPGLEGLRERYFPMLQSIIDKGSFVRFTWGLTTDRRLNHHPDPPQNVDKTSWQGRSFDRNQPELYVRAERQTLTGLREVNAILFTIRTYFTNVTLLTDEELQALESAIRSMSPASLAYKGLDKKRDEILDWLKELSYHHE